MTAHSPFRYLPTGWAIALFASALFAAACSDDDEQPQLPDYSPEAVALDLNESRALFHTWRQSFEIGNGPYVPFNTVAEDIHRLVHRVQLVEENRRFSVSTQPPPISTFFPVEEVNLALESELYGDTMQDFDEVTLVLDLMRLDDSWLLDWEGANRHEENLRSGLNFGLAQPTYEQAIQRRLLDAVGAWHDGERTVRVVLGAEMERYWLLNPEDWTHFVSFTRDVRETLAQEFPNVEFSIGINWSAFMERVVPTFLVDPGENDPPLAFAPFDDEGNPHFVLVQEAWDTVLEPLYFDRAPDPDNAERMLLEPAVDFYAFASIPAAGLLQEARNLPSLHWRGVRTIIEADPARRLPVDWYAIGWTGETTVQQDAFLQRFLAEAGGLDSRTTAWFAFTQAADNECRRLTGSEIAARSHHCTRGLVRPSGQPQTPIHEAFLGR
ncbi:MAG: hypothetical protein EA398_04430 [Deltaproteobacteria bacterium]|nr:MAG: hypothetical protein EA398_04430 [Deltaproteobacteria bacterium]